MDPEKLIQEIRKHRLADLSDGMDALGLVDQGTMSPDMRPIRPGIQFAGYAYTLKLIPGQKRVKSVETYEEYVRERDEWCKDTYSFWKDLKANAKEKVLVVDMGGYPGGLIGSENGMQTKMAGMAGVVVDGGSRDSAECNIEKINIFCTKRTFNHVYGRLIGGGINIPVECAGVTVTPGDIVCADDDGVLVIPADKAEKVLYFAEAEHQSDQKLRAHHYKKMNLPPDETLGDAGN